MTWGDFQESIFAMGEKFNSVTENLPYIKYHGHCKRKRESQPCPQLITLWWGLYFGVNYNSHQNYDWEMYNSRENNF